MKKFLLLCCLLAAPSLQARVEPIEESSPWYASSNYRRYPPPTRSERGVPVHTPHRRPLGISGKDYNLAMQANLRVEHLLQKNTTLLNKNIPDEFEYFKQTSHLTFSADFGQQRFGHKAVELFADFEFVGFWDKNFPYTDGIMEQTTSLPVADAIVGKHAHENWNPLIWLHTAWMCVSLNAIGNVHSELHHYLQLGWFKFMLGRGISLGNDNGFSQNMVTLYNFISEKFPAGALLTGQLIKKRLSYDVLYCKLNDLGRNLDDTAAAVRVQQLNASHSWRGVGKDNDLFALRLKASPLYDSAWGTLEVEPYLLVNEASDQTLEIAYDCTSHFRIAGLALEHYNRGFEWGGEVAFNFGKQSVRAIDRNSINIVRGNNGTLTELFSHLVLQNPITGTPSTRPALVTNQTKNVAGMLTPDNVGAALPDGLGNLVMSSPDRFRSAFDLDFRGWMMVLDGAYHCKKYDLKIGSGGGYVSGDDNPALHTGPGKLRGFVSLAELYGGKRLHSIFLLDERTLHRPVQLTPGGPVTASWDMSFTNLQFVGACAQWEPAWKKNHRLTINPNCIFFWAAHAPTHPFEQRKARSFMGTELNIITNIELLKDLHLFLQAAVFVPGGLYKDMRGITLANADVGATTSANSDRLPVVPSELVMRANNAYHLNTGLTCQF